MNRITGAMLLALVAAGVSACSLSSAENGADDDGSNGDGDSRVYDLDYRVSLDTASKSARVELTLEQADDYLRELDMSRNDGRISEIEGDGEITITDERVTWLPPDEGGRLTWVVRIDHLRSEDTYDAFMGDDWALFRAEDIIPSADTRTLKNATSDTRLVFDLPAGWSSVTPYFGNDGIFEIENPERNFDTPTGWIVLGDIGVRFETISGVRTKIAGPTGHDVRRMDILALLRWTLPELLRILPDFPERLTIVSAAGPMWRGALSAPRSLYIHADRPLISENGTSTLLHEAVHIGTGLAAERGADWIVEGLAEYYGLEMLRRSNTISSRRHEIALEELAEWGRENDDLCGRSSSGSRTAHAVTVLAELDDEIKDETDGEASLDEVLATLAEMDDDITVAGFREIVSDIAGESMDALDDENLPGC